MTRRGVSVRGDVAWFDESLRSAKLGACRGSGAASQHSSNKGGRKGGLHVLKLPNLVAARGSVPVPSYYSYGSTVDAVHVLHVLVLGQPRGPVRDLLKYCITQRNPK